MYYYAAVGDRLFRLSTRRHPEAEHKNPRIKAIYDELYSDDPEKVRSQKRETLYIYAAPNESEARVLSERFRAIGHLEELRLSQIFQKKVREILTPAEEKKAAKAAREKAWRAAHPDRVKQYEQNRKKPKPSPEEREEAKRISKERRAAYIKKWEEDHKEERRAYMREYARKRRQRLKNPSE